HPFSTRHATSFSPLPTQTRSIGSPVAIALDTKRSSRNVRGFNCAAQARSSVEEHYLDTLGCGVSIPPLPTTILGVVPRDLASEGVVGRHLRQIPRQMENVAEM